ncbi:hypothetical protein HPC49_28615 [Pyxidicoccus fallax]|uniref:Peptidase C-terminal archaeal/bacterial domain-containing protein n=1 Tax=Pyxidicoccus fallax TaxID=394095 RepID=A0A848LTA1_9BACT|nr:hypothetical protein [Pyxidicoccus fallax]NMO21165.1 hypothetical protein [Pyxidicoccus fallax]NPC82169.1 hypothetical protein [Pyxidicoccus fallax]
MHRFETVSSRLLGLFTAFTLFACGGPAAEELSGETRPTTPEGTSVDTMPLSSPKPFDSGETRPLELAPASMEKDAVDLRVRSESPGGQTSLVAGSYSTSATNSATVNTANVYFNLRAGETLTVGTCGVSGASGSGDTYLRFYNPSGVEVAISDDACGGVLSNLSYVAPTTGTYLLRAGCFGSGACNGTVGYSIGGALFSYSASATNSATVNTTDLYVNLSAGQTITLGTCGLSGASGSGDTYLRFYNPSGVQVTFSDDAGGSCGALSNFTYYVSVSGTYVLRSGCYSSGACSGTVAYLLQ